jgi:hypothetical protein
MWVWHTGELLHYSEKRADCFDFCKRKNIGILFLQLILTDTFIEHQDPLRQFLTEAHAAHIKVHALDGHPTFSLRENHKKVLGITQAIIDFNAGSPPERIFDGVHYDIEPYLLPEFQTGERKGILAEYLAITTQCASLVHARDERLAYGADIPFWFIQEMQELAQTVGFDLIDICDNVAIMNYRRTAAGSDGIIAHGVPILTYAAQKKKRVHIGVETLTIEPEKTTFAGMSEAYLEDQLKEAEAAFLKYHSFAGFAIHYYQSYRKLCNE